MHLITAQEITGLNPVEVTKAVSITRNSFFISPLTLFYRVILSEAWFFLINFVALLNRKHNGISKQSNR